MVKVLSHLGIFMLVLLYLVGWVCGELAGFDGEALASGLNEVHVFLHTGSIPALHVGKGER